MKSYIRNMKIFDKDIDYVRSLIPELSQMNFDRNLCNLSISYNHTNPKAIAKYVISNNEIELDKNVLLKQKNKRGEDFPNYFDYLIRHELLHVSSVRYDSKNNMYYSGFSKYYYNENEKGKNEDHKYLEEGFINYLLCKDYNYNEMYPLQKLFAGQLTEIVGIDLMKDTFFGSRGISPIVDKLKSINISENKINEFFKGIEELETASYSGNITTLIPNMQVLMLDFYSKKIDSLNTKEEAISFKYNFLNMVNDTMDYGMHYVKHLFPKDSSYSIEKQMDIKSIVKTI